MKESNTTMSYSTKMRLGHVFLIASIALGIAYIVGTWRTEVDPNWVTLSGEVFWPVIGISIVFYIWAKNGKRTS